MFSLGLVVVAALAVLAIAVMVALVVIATASACGMTSATGSILRH